MTKDQKVKQKAILTATDHLEQFVTDHLEEILPKGYVVPKGWVIELTFKGQGSGRILVNIGCGFLDPNRHDNSLN